MSVHLNLKEVKILRIYAHKEKSFGLVFQGERTEERKNFWGKKTLKVVSDEGWYDTNGFKEKSGSGVQYYLDNKQYKIVDGVLHDTARIAIHTSSKESFIEYFDSNIQLEARIEEIRKAANCDFLVVQND
jgi:hypothetical protein